MKSADFEKYFRWCDKNGIRIYAMTHHEYNNRKLQDQLSRKEITEQEYNKRKSENFFLNQKSTTLHIAVETDGIVSLGNMVFNELNVAGQIELLYKMKFEKENRIRE